MNGDFHIKQITLPSGKKVEIVYFQSPDESSEDASSLSLEICSNCGCTMTYPVAWKEVNNDMWEIEQRCPECEWRETGIYHHSDVERYDQILNVGTDQLIDDLEFMVRSNMEEEIERFCAALDADAIVPFDF